MIENSGSNHSNKNIDSNSQLGEDQNISGAEARKVTDGTLGETDYLDTSAEGSVMPNEDNTAEKAGPAGNQGGAANIGNGLVSGWDDTNYGQEVDDLGVMDQDLGTEGVDTGTQDKQTSGEWTTRNTDSTANAERFQNSGDLGEVDPGQQNYAEDQDSRWAFRAGDFKTSQEEDPDKGSEKYGDLPDYSTRETTESSQEVHAENVGGTAQEDQDKLDDTGANADKSPDL